MTPHRLIALFLLLALPRFQNEKSLNLESLTDANLKSSTITLERKPCFGSCPDYKLVIYGSGQVVYTGGNYVKIKGVHEGTIQVAALRGLMHEFDQAKFFSIDQHGSGKGCACSRQCTDMPSAITELTVGGMTHRVDHYYGCGCAPKNLFELESSIDKAANVEQWTGDVSQAGPFGTTCFDTRHK